MQKALTLTLLAFTFITKAEEPRNLLVNKATVQQVKESLVPKEQWIKYPAYTDRAGWDAYTGSSKEQIIAAGEKYLDYQWKVVTATNYLEYERSGSRLAMEQPFGANNIALTYQVFAELAEGKGRFMDQIINGVWHTCEMSAWSLSAHLPVQKTKRSLPDYHEYIIDLTSGDMGAFLSWTWYFFHQAWDKTDPIIAAKVRQNIKDRVMDPYMARSDYWWQALDGKPGVLVNNWNPWCNANVMTCFLLLEDDKDKLASAVYKTMTSVDKFINYVKEDGACEEGPSYWGHAAGKLYDYLQLLSNATNGKLSLFDNPMIKSMGEYIVRSYVGNGWVVNFADASAKGGGDAALIYRFGKATGSKEMQQFAAYLAGQRKSRTGMDAVERDFFRTIENIGTQQALEHETPGLSNTPYTWYPQTQFLYMKSKQGFFFAAKGGHNNESHNHNDVGSFVLYVDETPMFIDAGVGTYTKQTFSSDRYSIWTMQSKYHNLPIINGVQQHVGAQYKAKDVRFDAKKKTFSLDISGAYTPDAGVRFWKRTYTLSDDKGLTISDNFELTESKDFNQLSFLTWAKPDISQPGKVIVEKDGKGVVLTYLPSSLDATVEMIPQTDTRLSNAWGSELYRVQLTAKHKYLFGEYNVVISKIQ